MPKAKLVTRTATSSTVTDDNLNKASALTHAEMDSNLINLRDSSFGIADDSSTVLQVTNDKTITIAGSGTVSTALSGDTLTLTGSGITASSTDTLTNKTFDANGTGNSISNIETADIAAATLVTAAEGIGSNNNDTTLPTSAAVKAYADSVGGGSTGDLTITGSTISAPSNADLTLTNAGTGNIDADSNKIINVTDPTAAQDAATKAYVDANAGGGTITALNNQAANRLVTIGATTTELDGEANMTFDGSTLAITGGLTTTTSLANDAITITDNKITSSRSNDNLIFETNGTGAMEFNPDGESFYDSTFFTDFFGATSNVRSFAFNIQRDSHGGTEANRNYEVVFNSETTLTGSGTASNFRPRLVQMVNTTDLAGFSYTRNSFSRGPTALTFGCTVLNSSTTASTINNIRGFDAQCGPYASSSARSQGNITVDRATAANATIVCGDDGGGGGGVFTLTDGYSYRAAHYYVSGDTLTNYYAYYYAGADNAALSGTNEYAFYDSQATLSRFGAVILANQSGDPSTAADSAHIYAKDVSASSEVFVRDEAGNVTQISPHNEEGEWQYWSQNVKTGKKVRINMEKMIRKLEEYTGETFIESE